MSWKIFIQSKVRNRRKKSSSRCLILRALCKKEGLQSRGYGDIAQLGEHLLCKQGVSGSIPLISTTGLGN